jgi:TRAP-type mannitol/chloroaromatic compound transport system substrate-binding protein
MFRSPEWIEEQLDRVLRRHEASVGYSTCFWHNVRTSRALFDRSDWFARLQQAANVPYPEPLRRAIVAKNHPLLRRTQSSYAHQIERAVAHGDLVSVNHRTAALLASYFDILFAVNRRTHPGEKRLLAFAEAQCPLRPPGMRAQVEGLLRAAGPDALARIAPLVDALDEILRAEHLYPEWPA